MLYFARCGRVLGFIFEVLKAIFGALRLSWEPFFKLLLASWAPWAAIGRHRAAPRRPRSNFPHFFPHFGTVFSDFWR